MLVGLVPYFVVLSAGQTANPNYLGLTPRQIVAVGRAAFNKKYQAKFGDSTAAMSGGDDTYAQALGSINAKQIAGLPATKRTFFKVISQELTTYANACMEVGTSKTGGGTIWNIYASGAMADREEVIQGLLNPARPAGKPRVVSDVSKVLTAAISSVKGSAKTIDSMTRSSGVSSVGAMKDLRDAEASLARIAVMLKNRSRADSDRTLNFCLKYAKLALNPDMD